MNYNISFRNSRGVVRATGIFMWIGIILELLVLLNFVIPPQPGSTLTTKDLFYVAGFFAFWIIVSAYVWNTSHRMLTLQGSVLTVNRGKLWRLTSTVDLEQVVSMTGGVFRDYRGTRYPYIQLTNTTGHTVLFDLNYYTKADKDSLLPMLTELMSRPNMVLQGDLRPVLSQWFGYDAAIIELLDRQPHQ